MLGTRLAGRPPVPPSLIVDGILYPVGDNHWFPVGSYSVTVNVPVRYYVNLVAGGGGGASGVKNSIQFETPAYGGAGGAGGGASDGTLLTFLPDHFYGLLVGNGGLGGSGNNIAGQAGSDSILTDLTTTAPLVHVTGGSIDVGGGLVVGSNPNPGADSGNNGTGAAGGGSGGYSDNSSGTASNGAHGGNGTSGASPGGAGGVQGVPGTNGINSSGQGGFTPPVGGGGGGGGGGGYQVNVYGFWCGGGGGGGGGKDAHLSGPSGNGGSGGGGGCVFQFDGFPS